MNKKSVRKGESLIVNGSFDKDDWFEGWKKGAPPHDAASLEEPDYEGGRIYVARLVDQATLEQKFFLPGLHSEGVTHVLSFLYQSKGASGFFRIARDDVWGENIELPVGTVVASDDPPNEILSIEDPLDFIPTYREYVVDLQPDDCNKSLAVLFGFPNGSEPAGMSFTRVHFGIVLEPLKLLHVQVDEQVHADGTVYLCRGATENGAHTLTFQEAAGGAWQGSEVALSMADENEDLDPNVVIDPKLGQLQMLENPWSFSISGTASVRELELMIVSKWDAEPCPLTLSIGDHRVALADCKNGDFDPIVNKQSVRLTGTVKSFYTDLPLVDRQVVWLLEGESKVTHTDSSGGVGVEYSPAVAGLQQVNIAIDSLYYTSGVLSKTLEVKVLAADPFDSAQVAFEGGAQSSWGSRAGYPHRGGKSTVRVSASPGSELPDYPLMLIWKGESAESLGITVYPPLNTPVDWTSGEVVWTLDCTHATKDGEFELLLAAERLRDTSSSNRMSLGLNRYIVGDTRQANRSPVIDQAERVQVLLQLVEPGTREGVENVEVEWQTPGGSVTTLTGQGGWTELSYQPTAAGHQDLVATIQVRGEEGKTLEETFPFTALATNPWKAEVEWTFDKSHVPAALGFVCWRGEAVILTLTPKSGSKLLDEDVTLDWRDSDPGLGLTFDPPIGVPKKLTSAGLKWEITGGATKSGRFELKLSTGLIIQNLELSGRLISRNLADEGRVSLDTTPVLSAVSSYPCLGANHAFSFLPNPLGPLSGLSMELVWNGIPAEQLNVIVRPAVGAGVEIVSGGAQWSLDCSNSQHAGDFSLQLTLPQLAMTSTSMAMSLGHNRLEIIGQREATIRPVLAENESARVWVQVGSFYTKAPVANIPVSWKGKEDAQALIVPTRGDGWSSYAYQPKTTGAAEVKAEVKSPYTGQSSSASLEVDALPTSPWLGVVFYRTPESGNKLGEKTAFPRRANNYSYSIACTTVDNPLMDTLVRLGWAGTLPNDLSVTVAPVLGDKRPMGMAGLAWGVECGNIKDGSFSWFAEADILLKLSPRQPFSLGILYD
ncbi:hypothetical protein LJR277_005099 [Pseudomonas sp. LjRoot277]|uniref:hypothetical protein n=1 Tax=Pseudomonas sp. LjRoot277 TaxID=3342307 RepID=UPI003ECE2C19